MKGQWPSASQKVGQDELMAAEDEQTALPWSRSRQEARANVELPDWVLGKPKLANTGINANRACRPR